MALLIRVADILTDLHNGIGDTEPHQPVTIPGHTARALVSIASKLEPMDVIDTAYTPSKQKKKRSDAGSTRAKDKAMVAAAETVTGVPLNGKPEPQEGAQDDDTSLNPAPNPGEWPIRDDSDPGYGMSHLGGDAYEKVNHG